MKQELCAILADMEKSDRPGYLAVMALMIIFNRQKGKEVSGAVKVLRTFTHGECKNAIKIIRTLPELQNGSYPVEEIVRFLRHEIMGKPDVNNAHKAP